MEFQGTIYETKHYPLMLNGNGWSVAFRSYPSPAVEVTGRAPTRDELWQCLSTSGMSPWLLAECLLLAAQTAPVLDAPNDRIQPPAVAGRLE